MSNKGFSSAVYGDLIKRALGGSSALPGAGINLTYDEFMKRGPAAPGERFSSPYGSTVLRWVRVRGAGVVIGSPLKRFLGDASRTGTAPAGSTALVFNTADTLLNADIAGAILSIIAGTGLGQHRPILESDEGAATSKLGVVAPDLANYIDSAKLPEVFNPIPDNTSGYSIYADWEVTRQTGDTDAVSGVALGTVGDGNFTLMVEQGPAPCDCAGNTDAITAGGLIVPSSTAGRAKGIDMTPADVNVALREAALYFAIGLHAWTAASGLALVDVLGRFRQ